MTVSLKTKKLGLEFSIGPFPARHSKSYIFYSIQFKQGIDTTTASINFLQKDNSELDQKITNAQAGREECS